MIPLAASTKTKLLKAENRTRLIRIFSDSTTATRLSMHPDRLDGDGGHLLTIYESVVIELPANQELFAISSGTPNISWAEVSGQHPRAIRI